MPNFSAIHNPYTLGLAMRSIAHDAEAAVAGRAVWRIRASGGDAIPVAV